MALSYNLGYQESISVHPTRSQNFAGKVYSNFPNIWEWVVWPVLIFQKKWKDLKSSFDVFIILSQGPPPAYPATEAPPVYDPPPPYPGSPDGKTKVKYYYHFHSLPKGEVTIMTI